MKKESEGTERSRDSRRVVSGDARHEGTEISILVRFEASNVVYAIDETGRDVMYTLSCKRSLEVRPIENRADCKVNNQGT